MILEEMLLSFSPLKIMLGMGFSYLAFLFSYDPSIPLQRFYHERRLNFVKGIIEMICNFVLESIYMLYYVY
jgi:hypothetical protein